MADSEQQNIFVGSYNLLHPYYARKWGDKEGLPENDGLWPSRCKRVVTNLIQSDLDIYLLQEVGVKEVEDINDAFEAERSGYAFEHNVHDGRGARDGVAVFWKKDRFEKDGNSMWMPFKAKKRRSQNYMGVQFVQLKDLKSGKRLVVGSLHICWSKKSKPLQTLKTYLKNFSNSCYDYVVIGGDFNKPKPPSSLLKNLGFETLDGIQRRQIDWILVRGSSNMQRTKKTAGFVKRSRELNEHGVKASDHVAEGFEFH